MKYIGISAITRSSCTAVRLSNNKGVFNDMLSARGISEDVRSSLIAPDKERVDRWTRRAQKAGRLAAIPSKYIELLESGIDLERIDRFEENFKGTMAALASKHMKPDIRICDVGCGPARFAQHIIPLMRKFGGKYVGIDHSPAIIKVAEQVLAEQGMLGPDIRFEICDASNLTHLSFGSTFDLIVNGQNLIHIVETPELSQAIGEQRKVLSPDGKVISYQPLADDNPNYRLNPRKNVDTLIRSERDLDILFAEHNFEQTGEDGDRAFVEYFDGELYSYTVYELS